MESITRKLKKLEEAGLKRSMPVLDSDGHRWGEGDMGGGGGGGGRAMVDGREVLLLCSNDYLGLAGHPALKQAAIEAMERYGFGAGASRLVSGNTVCHMELEDKIKEFKGTEAALVFNTGYHANIGVIPALAGRGDDIFSDKLNHASIVDGCILSRAKTTRYPHCDTDTLERLVKKSGARRKLIITDGVFSMDGDIAPVKDIISIAESSGATVLIDDAHATGVLGRGGRGTLEHFSVSSHPSVIQMGTLGKAMGAFGAFIAGGKELVELLISGARSFIYTTALPPSVCAAAKRAIELSEEEPERKLKLLDNAALMRAGLKRAGLDTLSSETQIIPVITGTADRTMAITLKLLEEGLFIQGIRPPTVPEKTARLRITVTSEHMAEDIEGAVKTIERVIGEQG